MARTGLHIYTDGSFKLEVGITFAYQAYSADHKVLVQQETVSLPASAIPHILPLGSVAAEVMGVVRALEMALKRGFRRITLHYDFIGIKSILNYEFPCKSPVLRHYVERMRTLLKELTVFFNKVKGHSGVPGNDKVDYLCKFGHGKLARNSWVSWVYFTFPPQVA